MLRTYALPLDATFDESVFVTEGKSCNVHFQIFRYIYEAHGQCTIIRCRSVPPQTFLYGSLAAADDKLLVS